MPTIQPWYQSTYLLTVASSYLHTYHGEVDSDSDASRSRRGGFFRAPEAIDGGITGAAMLAYLVRASRAPYVQ